MCVLCLTELITLSYRQEWLIVRVSFAHSNENSFLFDASVYNNRTLKHQ